MDGARLPKHHATRRFSPFQQTFVNEHVEMLLRVGVATVSESNCASGIVLVRKPDGTWRLCVDLRRINKLTKHDLGPLPRVEDLLIWLSGGTCFASLDMLKGYWQFPVEPGQPTLPRLRNYTRDISVYAGGYGCAELRDPLSACYVGGLRRPIICERTSVSRRHSHIWTRGDGCGTPA